MVELWSGETIAQRHLWQDAELINEGYRNSKSIIHRILKLLFASDVPLRCLHRSVAKQKLNLFEFASTAMAAGRKFDEDREVPD
jgi:hypothetical protein